ncbi:DNA gyrase subunit A [Candidatus Dojkabacteria bacterium]|nr:DNA gyrase subunit A [Candidatus Dojkabacteria bacterium]
MKRSYINYAMSVIVARALPDVRDGLKPSQRRILVTMKDLSLAPGGRYRKSAKIAGDTSGNYHPHGEAIVYPTMVKMAQDFNMRYPLVDGQGNFGSIDGDNAAAMRYTEARMSRLSWAMMDDLDKSTVEYILNYDGSRKEPSVLPAVVPNLLLNGGDGIAVGMATKIPPHNLTELIDAITAMVEKGNEWKESRKTGASKYFENIRTLQDLEKLPGGRFPEFITTIEVDELMRFIPGPDFPTGAQIYDAKEIAMAYATGRGRILIRAVAEIEEGKGGKFQIIITQIPYQVNKARLVAKMAELVRAKKIEGIADIRDESNREGIRIAVEVKRDGKPKTILNKLYKYTEMQKAFNANMLALVNGEPKVLNLKRILELFITFRQEISIRRAEFDLARSREREHILEGLMIALDHLDEVIRTIRESKDADMAKANLMKKFKLSEIQSQAILDMQLRRLAALERKKIQDEYKQIKLHINELLELLSSPEKILQLINDELQIVKEKYGDKRRTKVFKGGVDEFSEEDLVAKEDVIVTVSEQGYIKRIKDITYKIQRRGGKGVRGMETKEDDAVSHIFSCSTHDDILFFTNRGKVYQKKVYEIPEFGRTAKGQPVINLINIEQGELVTSILTKTKEGVLGEDVKQEQEMESEQSGKKYKHLFMATRKGTVKKTGLADFENIKNNGLIAIKLDQDDELAWVKPTTGNCEILLITKNAKSIHFHEKDVRPTGRATMGVKGINMKTKGDEVIAMDVIRKKEDFMLTISENGFGKITKLEQFPLQRRGGGGVFAARTNDKTGTLASARILDHPDLELLIVSQHGQVVRIPTVQLPERSRQTAGVILMKLNKGDKVAAIAII